LLLGKVPYYTLPPKRAAVEDANAVIISEDGREFNVDEIYKAEYSFISGLKSMEDFSHIEIPSNPPPEIDEGMLEVFLTTIVVIVLYLCHYTVDFRANLFLIFNSML
jgi:hypothetical protein